MLKNIIVPVLAGLTFVLTPSASAPEWGPIVDGLRMSLSISPNEFGNKELVITIENTNPKDVYVLLGTMESPIPQKVGVIVTLPDGSKKYTFYLNSGGGISPGRQNVPRVIPMFSRSSFSMRTLLGGWAFKAPELRRVETLLSQTSSSIHAELVTEAVGTQSGDCFPMQIHWRGKLVSNTLRGPIR
jgi:hypothetical protein